MLAGVDQSYDIVLIDGRRWYVCPVPRCGFRTPADAGRWSRDTLQVHLQLHYVAPTCPCCGKASEIAWDA